MCFHFSLCFFSWHFDRNYGSEIGLKICAINAGIKNHKSIIKKEKKKHDKIVMLAKSKLNSIEVLIFKALIDSNINHDKFVLINNVLKQLWYEGRNKKFLLFEVWKKY